MMPVEVPLSRHWWVNHPHGDRAEIDGSYLWLPNKNENGSRSQSHQNMTRLTPGDIVFSCAGGTIADIGLVLQRARRAPMSAQSGAPARSGRTDEGWLVPIRFVELAQPLRPKEHVAEIRPLLPHRQSPLRVSGEANQTVYLAEVPAARHRCSKGSAPVAAPWPRSNSSRIAPVSPPRSHIRTTGNCRADRRHDSLAVG